jgi:hypothetical protein
MQTAPLAGAHCLEGVDRALACFGAQLRIRARSLEVNEPATAVETP